MTDTPDMALPTARATAAEPEVSALRDGIANAAKMPIKAWDVTVRDYGVGRYYAASRGKALAEAWRCEAFAHLSFKEFLKMASCWRAMFVPQGFGDRITANGKPAFFVERNRAYVRAVREGQTTIGNYHPYDILPECYRPEDYRSAVHAPEKE